MSVIEHSCPMANKYYFTIGSSIFYIFDSLQFINSGTLYEKISLVLQKLSHIRMLTGL